MNLRDLLTEIKTECIQGSLDIDISDIKYDSRKVEKGDVFICLSGIRNDGHDYIEEVCKKGASAIIVERDTESVDGVTIVKTVDTRRALSYMSAAYFGYPAHMMKMIGITGTKGKTTTAYMVREILQKSGIKTGLIGTIESIIGDKRIASDNTTPESYLIQKYLHEMLTEGCKAVVMEVSSQGNMQKRVAGIMFDYGVFTNLEPDHIGEGEHSSFEEYIYYKSLLFRNCRTGIINVDDMHYKDILKGHSCNIDTFGTSREAALRAVNINLHTAPGCLGISYDVEGTMRFHVDVNIPGAFSVYNSLTAIAICRYFNIPVLTIQNALMNVKVKGRVEPIKISDRFTLMIDYAHNAMSLKSLLNTLKEYKPKRLVCLFGCGGNRSRDRRFEMGEISSNLADYTIATSDNPRYEKPEDILADIVEGIKRGPGRYIAICDRKEAIRHAIINAEDGDLIVLAGKGHEDYQEICGVKHHMDERDLIEEVINEMTEEERKRCRLLR